MRWGQVCMPMRYGAAVAAVAARCCCCCDVLLWREKSVSALWVCLLAQRSCRKWKAVGGVQLPEATKTGPDMLMHLLLDSLPTHMLR